MTLVDRAAAALAQARERLGDRAKQVRWIEGDATRELLASASVDLWHDRAVFHFPARVRSRLSWRARLALAHPLLTSA